MDVLEGLAEMCTSRGHEGGLALTRLSLSNHVLGKVGREGGQSGSGLEAEQAEPDTSSRDEGGGLSCSRL